MRVPSVEITALQAQTGDYGCPHCGAVDPRDPKKRLEAIGETRIISRTCRFCVKEYDVKIKTA